MSFLETEANSTSTSAENYAKSLGAKVVLKRYHAEAARFPTRESFNLFIKFLVSRDYNYRLANSVAQEVAFSLKAASLELRKLQESQFELGVL